VAVESLTLTVTSGEARGTSIALDGELVLGRSTVGLEGLRRDTEMSRVHARLWRSDAGELMIEDLGSRNGTYLNGTRIHGPRVLHAGDWLRTGQTTMELAGDDIPADGAPRYDALVENDEDTVVAVSGSPGHIRPWPFAAVLAALLLGGGIGAAVAASQSEPAKTTTMVVTRERPAPPRLVAPRRQAELPPPIVPAAAQSAVEPQSTYPPAARDAFERAFCGRSASAPKGLCGCTYVELTRREPYAELVAQVARSHGGRIAPAIARAARACGADA
jgi:hypothetical protein